MNNVLAAFGLTVFAGLATGVGSILAFTAKRTDYRFLSISTGFSAGVMLYVSFVEILYEGGHSLTVAFGEYWGPWINAAAFFGGMLLIGIIDNLIPAAENPHEAHSQGEIAPLHDPTAVPPDFEDVALAGENAPPGYHDHGIGRRKGHGRHEHGRHEHGRHRRRFIHELQHRKLFRVGFFTALAITIHNFPEGLATFFSALQDPKLGAAIAVAVALHNIPEGISVSVPIYYATGNRRKAFLFSLLGGLAEPAGAGIAYLMFTIFARKGATSIPPQIIGVIFAAVAGIMVYISLDELLPTSRAYGKGHDSLLGLVGGMLVMAVSLLLMR